MPLKRTMVSPLGIDALEKGLPPEGEAVTALGILKFQIALDDIRARQEGFEKK